MAIGRTVLVATDRLGRTWRIEQLAVRRVRVECAGDRRVQAGVASGRLGARAPGSRTHQRMASRSHVDRSVPSACVASPNCSQRSRSIRMGRVGVFAPCPRGLISVAFL
jgi:hypothetical protein